LEGISAHLESITSGKLYRTEKDRREDQLKKQRNPATKLVAGFYTINYVKGETKL
jgi:hypothetical protein